jgi:hypothetical protein
MKKVNASVTKLNIELDDKNFQITTLKVKAIDSNERFSKQKKQSSESIQKKIEEHLKA